MNWKEQCRRKTVRLTGKFHLTWSNQGRKDNIRNSFLSTSLARTRALLHSIKCYSNEYVHLKRVEMIEKNFSQNWETSKWVKKVNPTVIKGPSSTSFPYPSFRPSNSIPVVFAARRSAKWNPSLPSLICSSSRGVLIGCVILRCKPHTEWSSIYMDTWLSAILDHGDGCLDFLH